MKKVIFSLLAIFLIAGVVPNTAKAQDERSEFTLSYGVLSSPSLLNTFSDMMLTGVSIGTISSDTQYSGSFSLGYKYAITDRLGLGGSFTYESGTSKVYFQDTKLGKLYNNYYTIAAEMNYKYINHKHFALYGLLGAGATINNQRYDPNRMARESNNMGYFNFQVTPIGMKVGSKFGFFVEAGFGYKGIVSAGLFGHI